MALAIAERPARMSAEEFFAFYEGRPDEERWELLDGIPVRMMTPVFAVHNRITSNLERLLNDALARHDGSRSAYQRLGLALPEAGTYRPEPDVAVVDVDLPPDQRYLTRAYLLAEIVFESDRERVPGTRLRRVDAKRVVYRQHPACEAVLTIEQDRLEILLELRTETVWTSRTLTELDDELEIPSCGLVCRVDDVYANTPLVRTRGSAR